MGALPMGGGYLRYTSILTIPKTRGYPYLHAILGQTPIFCQRGLEPTVQGQRLTFFL